MKTQISTMRNFSIKVLGGVDANSFLFVLTILILMLFSVLAGVAHRSTHPSAWIAILWLWLAIGGIAAVRRVPLGLLAVGAGGGGSALAHILLVLHQNAFRIEVCCLEGVLFGWITWKLYKLELKLSGYMCVIGFLFALSVAF